MKAILEFNLPEEDEEFRQAAKAGDMHCAIFEFSQYLRKKLKYEDLSEQEARIYENVQAEFLGILEEYNVE